MAENPQVRQLVDALERAVETQFPFFERCASKEYEHRLDVTLKASLALMSATCAAYLRYYGGDTAPALFSLAIQNLQRLTALNLKEGAVTHDPDTPPPAGRLH